MTVIKVLNTNSISGGATEYQTVSTGYYRVTAYSNSTVSFNDGPAIQIVDKTSVLLKGSKPGQAKIVKGVADATADYYVGEHVYDTSANHPFSVGDYIAIVDDSTSPAINAAFLSAGTAGKKITAIDVHNNILSTDIDSSSTSTYTWSSGPKARIARAVKITAGGADIVVEEIQVVGG